MSARRDLGYVAESDLDLALLMDARGRGPMSAYIFERLGLPLPDDLSARRSSPRCGESRETDVELMWSGGAVFIEDKVDADFTTGQPESYQAEVRCRRQRGEIAAAVLVCPTRRLPLYAAKALDADGAPYFDAHFTCAELAEAAERHAAQVDDALAAGSALVMRAAEEPRPVVRPIDDPSRSAWGDAYRAIVAELAPPETLSVGPRSLRTATASAACFPSAGNDPSAVWSLAHMVDTGEVRMELLLDDEPARLPHIARVVRKKRMTWISIPDRPLPSRRHQQIKVLRSSPLLTRR